MGYIVKVDALLYTCWVILHAFFLSAHIFFLKINFFKSVFQEYIRLSNNLAPDMVHIL